MRPNNRVQRHAASGLRLQQGRNRRVRCNDWFSDPGTPLSHPPKAWNGPSSHPLPRNKIDSSIPSLTEVPDALTHQRRLCVSASGTSASILLSSLVRRNSFPSSSEFKRGRIREQVMGLILDVSRGVMGEE